jgi:hypothetical protein
MQHLIPEDSTLHTARHESLINTYKDEGKVVPVLFLTEHNAIKAY